MKPKTFKEHNRVYAKGMPIGPIPAYLDTSPNGDKPVVLCYGLTFMERILVLITGNIWVTFTTYDGNLNPIWLTTVKKQLLTTRKQRRDMEKKLDKIGVPKMDNPPPPPKKKIDIPPPGENLKAV